MVTVEFDSRLVSSPLPENIPAEKRNNHIVALQVPAGRSVNQTLKDLNLELSQAVTALVNGQTTDLEQPLAPGDRVRLLAQIAGGD